MRAPTRPYVRIAFVATSALAAALVAGPAAFAEPATDEVVVSSQDEVTEEELLPEEVDEESIVLEEEAPEPPAVETPAEEAPVADVPPEPPVAEVPEEAAPVVDSPRSEEVVTDAAEEEVVEQLPETEASELPAKVEAPQLQANTSEDVAADVSVLAEPTMLPPEYWNNGDPEDNFVAGDPTGQVSYAVVDGNIVLTAEGDTTIGVVYGSVGEGSAPTGVLIQPGESVVLPPTADKVTLYVVQAPKNGEGEPVILGLIYVYPDGTVEVLPYSEGGVPPIPVTEEDPGTPPAPGGGGGGHGGGTPSPEVDVDVDVDVGVEVIVDNETIVEGVTIYEGDNYFTYEGYGYNCTYEEGLLVVNGYTDLATGEEFVGAPEGQSFTTGITPVSEELSDTSFRWMIGLGLAGNFVGGGIAGASVMYVVRRRNASSGDPAKYDAMV